MRLFFVIFVLVGILQAGPEDREIWVIEQEFVKFGKKDAYEVAKKRWIADFEQFTAHRAPTIVGLENGSDNEYFYLIPLSNFAEIDSYRKQERDFKTSSGGSNRMIESQVINSLLNFKVLTIHQYKVACSYCRPSLSMLKAPKVSYEIYTLNPGSEEAFEQMLIEKVSEAVKEKSQACWRVWKMLFGAEVPKYTIAYFSSGEDPSHIQLVDASMNDVIRRKQEGKAVVRPELCISR